MSESEQTILGGLFGVGGGVMVGTIQWILYAYSDAQPKGIFWEMYSWTQTIAYIITIVLSPVIWAVCLKIFTSRFPPLISFCVGIVPAFIGTYTLLCWISISYVMKIIVLAIVCIISWWACLYFQDDISICLR
eukprot:270394_1